MITGTIYQSTKQQMLENKWLKKREELSKNKRPEREKTQEERMLEDFKERAAKEKEANEHAGTYQKLESGGKLTQDEISYLESHDPEALAKYRRALAEKKAYENQLKNCKTKEEAERVKMNKLDGIAMEAKKITNNPYIPKGEKLKLMKELNNRLCNIEEAHKEFTESQKYKDLPKESDLEKERIDETREREEKLTEVDNSSQIEKSEKLEKSEELEKEEQRTKKASTNNDIKKDYSFKDLYDEIRLKLAELNDGPTKIDIGL